MNELLIPSFEFNKKLSIVLKHAQGCWLEDIKNFKYIDHCLGSGSLILGHGNYEVVRTLNSQIKNGVNFATNWNESALKLSRLICGLHNEFERVAFLSTGSEAVSYAIRAARAFTGKNKIIRFFGAYHGHHEFNYSGYRREKKSSGIPPLTQALTLTAEFNDLASVERMIVENKDVAAIICEPIQRFIEPDKNFLKKVQDLCRSYGVLFILDEIVTGWRFSNGCLFKKYRLEPDLICLGKIIGGGLPLSAVAGRSAILNLGDSLQTKDNPSHFSFNGTHFGHPLAAASALTTLQCLAEKNNLGFKELNDKGNRFRQQIVEILSRLGLPAQVCGYGSMWRIIFSTDAISCHRDYLNSDIQMEEKFDYALLKQGLYTIPLTRKYLSFAHSSKDLELSLDKIELALRGLK